MTVTIKTVAEAFSRAAEQYDTAASVQQQAGRHLLSCMQQYVNQRAPVIADVGCGTGFFAQALVDMFQPRQYIGIDIAEGMLAVAKKNNATLAIAQWHCSEAENLLLADQSVDSIFANFSLQWCDDLSALMHSFYRVLAPGGTVCFTSLGEKTLHELRDTWRQVDSLAHVNTFYASDQWQHAIREVGLVIEHHYSEDIVDYFESPVDVMRELKTIGANVVKGHHRLGLTGKQRFTQWVAAYETYRTAEGIPATYGVDGWVIRKPL